MTTYTIKRGGIWQDGKHRTADHEDKELRTCELSDKDRDLIDPKHVDLQSAAEAKIEAEKLQLEAELSAKKAKALAAIDAEHKAKPVASKGGGK